jgi:N-methylhydantoinase B
MSDTMTEGIATDPVLLAVFANRLDSICREMQNTLLRSARSSMINVARDFSCSIVTSDNELLVSAEGLPVHVLGSQFLCEAMCDLHPDFAPGDAFLHNDVYLGNSHGGDHSILVPVFFEGEHVFTTVAKAHQADIGNAAPTTYAPFAKDVYEEGALIFPCVRIQKDYEDVQDIVRMCQRRIRIPEQWYGDYLAGVGAARIGERRLRELCEERGVESVRALIQEWFAYGERRMIAALKKMPAGSFPGMSSNDPYPGIPDGVDIRGTTTIDPEEGRVVVDLTDNPDNYPGGLNLSKACATAAAMIGVLNSIDPEVPHNEGSYRRITVQLREGCIVGIPKFPHSCSMATTNFSDRVQGLTQTAFAELGDGYGAAEGNMGLSPAIGMIAGEDPQDHRPYITQVFYGSGGGPASPTADGWPTYQLPACAGMIHKDSVELSEQRYPIRIYEESLVADGEGAGRQRGGLGSRVAFGPIRGELISTYALDGHVNPPRGVRGGTNGSPQEVWHRKADGSEADIDVVGALTLQPGEAIVTMTSSGGGYGDPLERDPELVREDVSEGWISRERAESVYGVVVQESAQGVTVDAEATARTRRDRQGAR